MAEEEQIEDNSIEEEKVENEPEVGASSTEEDEESAPWGPGRSPDVGSLI